jgi:transcriptional regulator with XRE-family HTH domain
MEVRALVAWNLRRIRVRRGISQEQLALAAEVDVTYVSGIERALRNPTIMVLERLAIALDVRIGELLLTPRMGAKRPSTLPKGRPSRS